MYVILLNTDPSTVKQQMALTVIKITTARGAVLWGWYSEGKLTSE